MSARTPKELLKYYRDEIDALAFRSSAGPDTVDRQLLDAADNLLEDMESCYQEGHYNENDRCFNIKLGFLQMMLWRADMYTRAQLQQQLENNSILRTYWSEPSHPNSCPKCSARAVNVDIVCAVCGTEYVVK